MIPRQRILTSTFCPSRRKDVCITYDDDLASEPVRYVPSPPPQFLQNLLNLSGYHFPPCAFPGDANRSDLPREGRESFQRDDLRLKTKRQVNHWHALRQES